MEFGCILPCRYSFQFVNFPWMFCINENTHPSSQVFDGIKVRWLRLPFQDVDHRFIQPFSHHFSLVPRVVVTLESPSPSKSKFIFIFLQVFLENLIILLSHNSFYTLKSTYTWRKKYNPITLSIHHHASLKEWYFSDSWPLLCLIQTYFTSFRRTTLYFCFFWPQNMSPKYVVFIHMFLGELQSSF